MNRIISKVAEETVDLVRCDIESDEFLTRETESPIEAGLLAAIGAYCTYWDRDVNLFIPRSKDIDVIVSEWSTHTHNNIYCVPQCQIDDWRIDFLFLAKTALAGEIVRLIVECDGHDFHERTREQAVRDRSRDREFQARGYTVFRFTGAEIWRDPIGCAAQVIKWAMSA